jgi:hypothetical protein
MTSAEVPKLWDAPPGGAVGPQEGAICLYKEHIYFDWNMGAK